MLQKLLLSIYVIDNVESITSKYIDQTTCHHAARSLILSRLDYCNGLLSSLPSTYITLLQRLQNWAARLVFEVDRKQSPKPLLKHYIGFQYDKGSVSNYFCLYNVFITKDLSTLQIAYRYMFQIDNSDLEMIIFVLYILSPEF